MEPMIRPVLWSITILNCCWLVTAAWLMVVVVTGPRLDTLSVTRSVTPPVAGFPPLAISSSL